MYHFTDVSLLITHYNRSKSLERLLIAFRDLKCEFEEIVVSDDGSNVEHQSLLLKLQSIFKFKLITSSVNKGLGNNLNKGQRSVNGAYTLYIQEDFIPTELFPRNFINALKLIRADDELDIIRLYAYDLYPYLQAPHCDGFSTMVIKPYYLDYMKIYYYSDHPHLRRSNFLEKFGEYQEGIAGDRTEYRMCLSFIQKKGKGLFFEKYSELFIQDNPNSEPSTMTRNNLTNSNNPIISLVRYCYRQIKYNYDIHFFKT